MTRWIDPPLDQRTSDCGEYTLAFTVAETERSETQKFTKKKIAELRCEEIRNNGDFAFVFDPDGRLV